MTKSKWPLLITIFFLTLLLLLSQPIQDIFVFNRTKIHEGQWWRIFTGNLTHSNYFHLILNLAGLWILVFLFIDTLKSKTFILSTLFISLIVGFGLYYFSIELHTYFGFSGTLYGLYIISAISAILHKDYFTGFAVVFLVTGKIVWDYFNGGNSSSAELIGVPVATDAHLYGIIGAILISVILYWNHLNTVKKTHNKMTPPHF
jgi:rhomboid family GlyGly-CTERM serine protease